MYTARHLRLTDLARANWDLHGISTFAGHRNVQTEPAPAALLSPSSTKPRLTRGRPKPALRTLLHLLASLRPTEVQSAPQVAPDIIRRRIEPMVKGLVQDDWQEIALREIIARTFILNFQGAEAAINAELSTCFMGSAWRILGPCSGITGSSQKMLRSDATALGETLRTCGGPPTRLTILTVTLSFTKVRTGCTV